MYLSSLSFGVKDILEGRIKLQEVDAIVSGTKFSGPEEATENYSRVYWAKAPKECADICRQIWPKVLQPRAIFGDEHCPYCSCEANGIFGYDTLEEFEKACSVMPYNVITELKEGGYIS